MNKKVIYAIIAIVVIIIAALGILFFVTKNKKEINLQQLDTIISEKAPFNEIATMDVDKEILSLLCEINAEDVEEVIGKLPLMNVDASMYLVIKAKNSAVDNVKAKVDQYAKTQEEMWLRYLPAQYDLVMQRKSGVVGNYIYLFISENSSELESLVK